MPKVSQEHLDARRAQILGGAQRAFARHGYEGATVARLEEETGLSRGAIFNYFGSKQDLFIELALATSIRYGNLVLERGLEPAIRAMAEEDPDWLGVLFEMDARLRHEPEFLRRLEAAQEDESPRIVDWFAARQADGTFRDDVGARELGRFATIVLNGFALRVLAGDETDVDALLQLLDDALAPRK
jgi:TetR/AcrR family transcriptional regulator, transcriptional repressor of aconitase